MWTPAGGGADVPVASTVTATSVQVVLPASIIASAGGLPLKWWLNNSCRDFPSEKIWESTDLAPNAGLFTLAADPAPDVRPNIAGAQATVPAGMFQDAAGACVKDACPNLAGGQASAPAGYQLSAGTCLQVTFTGSARADNIIGNAIANVINGLAGNDKLAGRAGNDTLRGGTGNDNLLGEVGNDKLQGDAGNDKLNGADRKRGDVLIGCERKLLRA